ncbi:hypothetical protein RRG08_027196 [Elysia crispata]|uniref:Uncharacterized protein n=1 Tax=Elysia crispata TaxID=231223 RepID=A0AAE1A882_9GAST|nr:hypothetical protein RRG08_027196 [Elysia crispata]
MDYRPAEPIQSESYKIEYFIAGVHPLLYILDLAAREAEWTGGLQKLHTRRRRSAGPYVSHGGTARVSKRGSCHQRGEK